MSDDLRLPPLQQTLLDAPTTAALFRDLAACTEVLSVTPKTTATGHTTGSLTLADAQAGLADGTLRAAQIRYRYDGAEWCDTLLTTPGGLRVVRVCQSDVLASVLHERV